MKSTMPFAGVATPELRKLCKESFKRHPIEDPADWQTSVADLWRNAEVREMRHAAIELLLFDPYKKKWLTPAAVPLLREMIETGAWWDYVDTLAINGMGHLLKHHTTEIKKLLEDWATDKNLWIRRTAILSQLKFKADTDEAFLFDAIEGSITDSDFFARKAIGWALREYSKTAPDTVVRYVEQNRARLSPLSKREALKVLIKRGYVEAVP